VHPVHAPEQVLERLGGLPGGPELLARASRREDVALVGGAVRDLLLGHWPRELDVTVAADAAGLARELAAAVSPGERAYGRQVEPVLHERFGTASVAWEYGRIDIAERRAESYPRPGALPEVRPGSFEEDLRRRDFTVNAIALPLHGAQNEGLLAVEDALADLRAGRLRVLHERSFIDDPTRILRLARYAARLGFEIEPRTGELAAEALREGALETVSGDRLASELWLAAREPEGRVAMEALGDLGVLAALGLAARFDGELAAEAEAFLPADGERDVLLIAVALSTAFDEGGERFAAALESLARLGFSDGLRARVQRSAASDGPAAATTAAEAYALLEHEPLEGAAILGALAARRSPEAGGWVRDWLERQRHVKLEIDGNDLIAAGVPQGPEVGIRLAVALARKRAGEVVGREQELRAALEYELPRVVDA
jgi:tRNA nucleotidyltransferase (CCA-adding enzyme)